ncbi:MAG: hypothetical protein IJT33_01520 [Campylobacter sp.]|nr:hypothetical protein [Campylobacter sp.]
MIKFNKYKKFGGQGCPPYNTSDPREQIKDTYYLFKNGAIDIVNSIQEQTNKKEKK